MKKIQQLLFGLSCFFLVGCNATEEKIESAVLLQLNQYPESTLQDIYKNFYQNRFGPGHAIANPESVKHYLKEELLAMDYDSTSPMIEELGWDHRFIRIYLRMVKEGQISEDDLNDLFIESAFEIAPEAGEEWKKEWEKITRIIEKKKLPVKNFLEDKKRIDSLLNENSTIALHHSNAFRQYYHPHYRVVRKDLYEKKFGNK